MKTLLTVLLLWVGFFTINKETTNSIVKAQDASRPLVGSCGPSYATLITGPRGGCFYINRNGNKSYVTRSCCD